MRSGLAAIVVITWVGSAGFISSPHRSIHRSGECAPLSPPLTSHPSVQFKNSSLRSTCVLHSSYYGDDADRHFSATDFLNVKRKVYISYRRGCDSRRTVFQLQGTSITGIEIMSGGPRYADERFLANLPVLFPPSQPSTTHLVIQFGSHGAF